MAENREKRKKASAMESERPVQNLEDSKNLYRIGRETSLPNQFHLKNGLEWGEAL